MSGGVEGCKGESTGAEQSSDEEDDRPHPHELPDGTGSKPPEGSNKHKYLFACCSETHTHADEHTKTHTCAQAQTKATFPLCLATKPSIYLPQYLQSSVVAYSLVLFINLTVTFPSPSVYHFFKMFSITPHQPLIPLHIQIVCKNKSRTYKMSYGYLISYTVHLSRPYESLSQSKVLLRFAHLHIQSSAGGIGHSHRDLL